MLNRLYSNGMIDLGTPRFGRRWACPTMPRLNRSDLACAATCDHGRTRSGVGGLRGCMNLLCKAIRAL